MKSYYQNRAPVYDRVYAYPERQQDLRFLEDYIPRQFSGRKVLEIAAGTGYWTQFIAPVAESMTATDVTSEALIQAGMRPGVERVTFSIADAYALHDIGDGFDGIFAGLWLSHVPRQRREEFLASMHRLTTPGSVVVFLDNSPAQCERLPISFTDEHGNTYQDRALDDGSVYRVLKNFPTITELLQLTDGFSSEPDFIELKHFWVFRYVYR